MYKDYKIIHSTIRHRYRRLYDVETKIIDDEFEESINSLLNILY